MNHFTRRLSAGAALVASFGLVACGADGSDSDDPDAASASYDTSVRDSAASWLTTQLDDGLAHNREFGIDDYSLSADIAIALEEVDVEEGTVDEITAALEANKDAYVAPGFGTVFSTGSAAKLAIVLDDDALADEVEAHSKDGIVADELDPKEKKATDYANVIGQSFAVEATESDDLVAGLIGQQCDDGGFPQDFTDGSECTSSTDATAFAVLALESVDDDSDELAEAVTWLSEQQAEDGSFSSTQPPVANTNTTGLAGWALGEADETEAAEQAATWVSERVLGCDTDAPGAIAYDDQTKSQAESKGITKKTEGVFRLASAQALPVLDYLPEDAVPEGVGNC